ncbi:MAG TPA: porin family protein [Vicinamibacterales bacterium]|nr:porin family protein [Vicinamibacterales bacterium]
MRSLLRRLAGPACLGAAGLLSATPAAAQGFGIGARMAWVRSDVDLDVDSVRFTGGQIRLGLSPRFGVEVSLDRHSESFELLNEKVTETPIQASLLMRLAGGSFSPYLLGGPGWYSRKVETIEGPDLEISSREFGWHAGGGLEVRLGKHAGIHGDYRYTFLDFNGDDDDEGGFIRGLLPGHKGSMWTLGATVYF